MVRSQTNLLDEVKSANARWYELSWELDEVEHRLAELIALREDKVDMLLEREIHMLQQKRSDLEDHLLQHMLQTDELNSQIRRNQPHADVDENNDAV